MTTFDTHLIITVKDHSINDFCDIRPLPYHIFLFPFLGSLKNISFLVFGLFRVLVYGFYPRLTIFSCSTPDDVSWLMKWPNFASIRWKVLTIFSKIE